MQEYFKLKDRRFEIEKAELCLAFFDEEPSEKMKEKISQNKLKMFLDIKMKEKRFEEILWKPHLYVYNGIELSINSWKDLENKNFEYEFKEESSNWILYIFEHEDITKGKIEVLERKDNCFLVKWTGQANIFWDEEYNRDVPFECVCTADFTGLVANCEKINNIEPLKKEISKLINLDEFVLDEQKRLNISNAYANYEWRFKIKQ